MTGPDKRGLDDLANALVREFQRQQRSETRSRKETKRGDLEGRIRDFKTRQNLSHVEKRSLLDSHSYDEASFEWMYDNLKERQKGYQEEYDKVQREIFRDRPVFDAIEKARQDAENPLESLAQLPQDRLQRDVQRLENQIEEQNDEMARLIKRAGLDVKHPSVQEVVKPFRYS